MLANKSREIFFLINATYLDKIEISEHSLRSVYTLKASALLELSNCFQIIFTGT